MISFPNAKINLGLNIVGKRADGYHNLETIFYPIPLEDILEIEVLDHTEKPFELSISGIPIKGNLANNLVVKAYLLLKEKYNLPPIHIYLHKNIPSGAGLGGGSSDAAFMLKLLNDTFELNLTTTELEEHAAKLGADCAFFIQNKPTFAEGIGNIFSSIELNLSGYQIFLIKPDVFISTAMAFSNIKPHQPELNLKEIIQKPISQWHKWMANDFEESIFKEIPELGKIKEELYQAGAIYASMSGAGSSIYGIFKDNCTLIPNSNEGKYLLNL